MGTRPIDQSSVSEVAESSSPSSRQDETHPATATTAAIEVTPSVTITTTSETTPHHRQQIAPPTMLDIELTHSLIPAEIMGFDIAVQQSVREGGDFFQRPEQETGSGQIGSVAELSSPSHLHSLESSSTSQLHGLEDPGGLEGLGSASHLERLQQLQGLESHGQLQGLEESPEQQLEGIVSPSQLQRLESFEHIQQHVKKKSRSVREGEGEEEAEQVVRLSPTAFDILPNLELEETEGQLHFTTSSSSLEQTLPQKTLRIVHFGAPPAKSETQKPTQQSDISETKFGVIDQFLGEDSQSRSVKFSQINPSSKTFSVESSTSKRSLSPSFDPRYEPSLKRSKSPYQISLHDVTKVPKIPTTELLSSSFTRSHIPSESPVGSGDISVIKREPVQQETSSSRFQIVKSPPPTTSISETSLEQTFRGPGGTRFVSQYDPSVHYISKEAFPTSSGLQYTAEEEIPGPSGVKSVSRVQFPVDEAIAGPSGLQFGGTKKISDLPSGFQTPTKIESEPGYSELISASSSTFPSPITTVPKRPRKKTTQTIQSTLIGTPKKFTCSVCQKSFTNASKLETHMNNQHSATASTSTPTPSGSSTPFSCEHCKKCFSSKFKLVRHVLIHSDRRPFQCTVCERTFHRKDHLKNHIKVHSPVKKIYVCDREHCKKEYTSILSYKKHIAIHYAEEGSLECKICYKTFSSKDDILYHLKIHAGSRTVKNPSEKKYHCDICKRTFFTRKDVRRHLVVHTGRRDFLCQFCPQRFGRKDHLVRHIKKSHGETLTSDISRTVIKTEPGTSVSEQPTVSGVIIKQEQVEIVSSVSTGTHIDILPSDYPSYPPIISSTVTASDPSSYERQESNQILEPAASSSAPDIFVQQEYLSPVLETSIVRHRQVQRRTGRKKLQQTEYLEHSQSESAPQYLEHAAEILEPSEYLQQTADENAQYLEQSSQYLEQSEIEAKFLEQREIASSHQILDPITATTSMGQITQEEFSLGAEGEILEQESLDDSALLGLISDSDLLRPSNSDSDEDSKPLPGFSQAFQQP